MTASRRLVTLGAVTLGLVAALAPAAAADPAAAAAPRTGFEQSNGARWTTTAEEHDFLNQIDKASRRVAVERIGTSVRGLPLHLVRIGDPAPPPKQLAALGSTALFVCSQHGDEPSGREGCLSTIRDLAFSKDPAVAQMLRHTSLLFVPTANPDGRVANTRTNANGVDINRDHVALESPEARAMAEVIRDYRPDISHDLHEYGATPPYYDRDVLNLWSRNLNVNDKVHSESVKLSKEFVRPEVKAAGYTIGDYGIFTDPVTGEPIRQVAGDGQERIMRNTVGLKHSVGMLLETRDDPRNAAEKADPALNKRRRVDSQLIGLRGTFSMIKDRWIQLAVTTTASRLSAAWDRGPIYFGGADNEPAKPEQIEKNPPCGYRLTTAQYDKVRVTLDLHGVRSRPTQGGRLVTLHQETRPLIPLLLDPRAQYRLTEATPLPTC